MGTGVLGPVYRARESDGDRTVAVKSFQLELTPEQVEIFGNALAHVVNVEVSHPAIVAPLAAGLESGTPFLAYEYVAAESLDVALRREARPSGALEWIAALAGAVDAAHARGLVHGALHLRDVLVSPHGVCATGFGIASALEHVGLAVPVRRPYTAPEVTAGRRWGPEADRYALAVLAYELLTGTRMSGTGEAALADLRGLRPDAADVAGLQQAFRNALAEDPDIRSASAAGFVTALARGIGGDALEFRPAAAPEVGAGDVATGFLDAAMDKQHGGRFGDVGYEGDEAAFDAPLAPGGAGESRRDSAPPVRIVLPDTAAPLADRAPVGGDAEDDGGGEVRGDRKHRSRRASRSKRRPPRRADAPRRAGPVVAVRNEVQWDPLDDRSVGGPPADEPANDDDVPPPPSPTSMRAMAPVIAAVAVGVLLAYLVITGLGTPDEGASGGAAGTTREAGVEWSEETVAGAAAGAGAPALASAAGAPRPLVGEPVVPVGDPPLAGGDPPTSAPRPIDPDPPAPAARAPVARAESPAPPGPAEVAASRPRAAAGARAPAAPPASPPRSTPRPPVGARATPAPAAVGSLLVESRPAGAAVRIDGIPVGATPVDVPGIAIGRHRVRIELPGYRPWVTDVDVAGPERTRVGASLQLERRR